MTSRRIGTATVLAVALAAAACGQKDGVGAGATSSAPAPAHALAGDPSTAALAPGEGMPAGPPEGTSPATAPSADRPARRTGAHRPGPEPADRSVLAAPARPRAASPAPAPGPTPGASGPEAVSSGRPASGGGVPPDAGPPARPPSPGPPPSVQPPRSEARPADRTGVTESLIRIGIHAPITGAAPFPQNSFDKGTDVYWKFLAGRGGVHGRNVEVILVDDQYNPARAVQVCRELVEQRKVLLLTGFGTEQANVCARYADSVGVPYLAGGANEDGVGDLGTYFAISQSYRQSAPIIAAMVRKELGMTRVAVVVNDTPLMDETVDSFTEHARAQGLAIVRTSRISKNASDSELLAEANQLKASGAEAVYVMTAPVNFIKLATNARAQAYAPSWVGPFGNGLNLVAQAGCPSIEGARFLSPWPGLDVIDQLDPDFRPAYARYAGGEPDDLGLALWGTNKVLHKMFEATGRDLSRQSLMATLTSGVEINTNVFPTLRYTATSRFGAGSSHVLEADCSRRQYKTAGTFVEAY